MENLSEEVRQRIELNKAQALARRKQKEAERIAQQAESERIARQKEAERIAQQKVPSRAPEPVRIHQPKIPAHHGSASSFFGKKSLEATVG